MTKRSPTSRSVQVAAANAFRASSQTSCVASPSCPPRKQRRREVSTSSPSRRTGAVATSTSYWTVSPGPTATGPTREEAKPMRSTESHQEPASGRARR